MALTNWVTLAEDDVLDFMTQSVVGAASELDEAGNTRAFDLLPVVTDRIRGSVLTGNRNPLSLTPNSIPPEGRWHALCLVVYALVEAHPVLGEFAFKDGFTRRWEEAEKWVRNVASGQQPVSPPTDPDTTTGPQNTWGDVGGPQSNSVGSMVDLSTDGPVPTPQDLFALPTGPWEILNGQLLAFDTTTQLWYTVTLTLGTPPQFSIQVNPTGQILQWVLSGGQLRWYDYTTGIWWIVTMSGAPAPQIGLAVAGSPSGTGRFRMSNPANVYAPQSGVLQGFNASTGLWHSVILSGSPPQFTISPQGTPI